MTQPLEKMTEAVSRIKTELLDRGYKLNEEGHSHIFHSDGRNILTLRVEPDGLRVERGPHPDSQNDYMVAIGIARSSGGTPEFSADNWAEAMQGIPTGGGQSYLK